MGIDESRARLSSGRRVLVVAVAALLFGDVAALAVHEGDAGDDVAAAAAPPPAASPTDSSSAVAGAPSASTATSAVIPRGTQPTTRKRATSTTAGSSQAAGRPPVDFPVMAEGYRYELELTPTCARVGELFRAVMRLKANSGSAGSFIAYYADGTNEEGRATIAEPDGTVKYSWAARPVPGEGRLVTQAMDGETSTFGTKIVPFRVVEATKSC